MSGATSHLRRAAEAIGRAVVAAGAAAASAPVLGLPPGPPVVACYPDVVWVVVSNTGAPPTAWASPESAELERAHIAQSRLAQAYVTRCVVRL